MSYLGDEVFSLLEAQPIVSISSDLFIIIIIIIQVSSQQHATDCYSGLSIDTLKDL